jgi:multiple RNA-binding domain-containing protein 1
MQPASKVKTWDPHSLDDASNEPPTKIQAIEIPEGESDEEYEAVPRRPEKKKPESQVPTEPIPAASEPVARVEGNNPVPESTAPDATDDDWLRGRTNRLLDLMDPEDIAVTQEPSIPKNAEPVAESNEEVTSAERIEEPTEAEEEWEGIEDDKPDPVIEAIKTNGRLFVRNLPYSATEDDLREHFAPYGALEEVWSLFSFLCALHAL